MQWSKYPQRKDRDDGIRYKSETPTTCCLPESHFYCEDRRVRVECWKMVCPDANPKEAEVVYGVEFRAGNTTRAERRRPLMLQESPHRKEWRSWTLETKVLERETDESRIIVGNGHIPEFIEVGRNLVKIWRPEQRAQPPWSLWRLWAQNPHSRVHFLWNTVWNIHQHKSAWTQNPKILTLSSAGEHEERLAFPSFAHGNAIRDGHFGKSSGRFLQS